LAGGAGREDLAMSRGGLVTWLTVLVFAAGGAAAQAVESPEIAVSPDDRHLYIGGWSTTTFERDQATGALTQIDDHAPAGKALAMAPDGRHLYVAFREGIHVLSRDAATGLLTHETTVMAGAAGMEALAASPDGHHLYAVRTASDELVVLQRDPATGALRRMGAVFGGGSPGEVSWLHSPRDIAVAPDGAAVYVALGDGLGTFRRDAGTGALTPVEPWTGTGGTASDVAVSADGKRVYAGRGDVWAFERDLATGGLTSLTGLMNPCGSIPMCNEGWSIAPSPDGTLVFTTRHLERNLVQAAVVPEGLARQADYLEGQDGAQGLDNPLELAWSRDSRFLYVGAMRNLWFENGDYYITSPDYLATLAVYRRDTSTERLQFAGLLRPERTASPPGLASSVTINDGARFTRSPDVKLTITGAAFSFRLSNDGTFGGSAARLRSDAIHPWTLEDTGLGRDVRRVHVRFTDAGYGSWSTDVSDDIVLDQRPPLLSAARARRAARGRVRLLLRARDNRSGVRKLQLTSRRGRPGKRVRFQRAVMLRRLPARSWARVIDGAGNQSRWRRVRLTHQSTG
jgi:6-phosphogluconolactonase (cycloisomerase 2 family)